jgi:dUTP pyrophosphatase
MQVKLKLFDKSLPAPQYQTEKAAGVDLYSRIDVAIPPHQVIKVPLNVALQIPDDHFVLISARSSLHKKGLMLANGIGIGDADYCGDEDEYQAAIYNFSDQPVEVKRGERLVQIIVLPRPKVELELVETLSSPNRGGFGSTG